MDHNKMPTLVNDYHVAVPTAFYQDEKLNITLTLDHVQFLYQKGVRSVLICGSTGEQHSLSCDEKIAILQAIGESDALADDLEIIFGVASVRLKDVLKLAQEVNRSTRISAALLGFPPYILPTQQEAAAYVRVLANALNRKNVILYNNPKRTGFDLTNETLINLLQDRNIANIIGIKEAGDPNKVKQLIDLGLNHLHFYAGGEPDLQKKVALGFNRLSSILGNIYPQEVMNYFFKIKNGTLTVHEEDEMQNYLHSLLNSASILPTLKAKIAAQENSAISYCRAPLGLV